jgi:hypothetical protein
MQIRSNWNVKIFGVFTALSMAAGCGPLNNVQEMADTTQRLKETADELQKELDANLLLAKEVVGKSKREQCLQELLNSRSFETMVMNASCYFMSHNFQAWTGIGEDTPERREQLFEDAVHEFVYTLPNSIKSSWFHREPSRFTGDAIWDFELAKLGGNPNAVAERARTLSFYALAATLHQTHPLQKFFLEVEGTGRPEVAMYDLLYQALVYGVRQRADLLADEDVPGWAIKALQWESDVRELMRARVVTLTTTALIYASRIPKMGKADAQWFRFRHVDPTLANVFRPSWTPDYEKLYPHELELYTEWLELAEDGLTDLENLDLTPVPVSFSGLSKNLLNSFKVAENYEAVDPVTQAAVQRFENAVVSIRDRIKMQLAP